VTSRSLLVGDLQITEFLSKGFEDGRLDLRPIEQVGFFHRQFVLVDEDFHNTGNLHDLLHDRAAMTAKFAQIRVGGAQRPGEVTILIAGQIHLGVEATTAMIGEGLDLHRHACLLRSHDRGIQNHFFHDRVDAHVDCETVEHRDTDLVWLDEFFRVWILAIKKTALF